MMISMLIMTLRNMTAMITAAVVSIMIVAHHVDVEAVQEEVVVVAEAEAEEEEDVAALPIPHADQKTI